MSTRRAKQLIYGTLYIVVLFAVVSVFYLLFIHPFVPSAVPPCTSGCMPADVSSISKPPVSVFLTSPGHYTFLAAPNNVNPDFGIEGVNYSIDLRNSSGTIIQAIPVAPGYLYAGQNKFIVVPNQTVPQQFQSVALDIANGTWIASSTMGPSPQFIVQNIQTGVNGSNVTVGGQIVNNDIATYAEVAVVVLFKDNSGEYIGATATEIDGIGPDATVPFSVMYPISSSVDPAKRDVFVYGLRTTVAQ